MTARQPVTPGTRIFLGLVGVISLLLIWELAGRMHLVDPVFVSSPTRIVTALIRWWIKGVFLRDLGISLVEMLVGFGSAAVSGILIGVIMARNNVVKAALDPFVWLLYSTPIVAFWPLCIAWLGIGFAPITVLSFLFAVIPVIVNTSAGVTGVDPMLIRCARSFNASRADLLLKFILPAALPMVMAGLRIAIGRALIGVVVGELFVGQAGLGFQITTHGARLRFDDVFAGVLMVVVVGMCTTKLVRMAEVRLIRWKSS